jgi:hypothetical protein
MSDAEGGNKVAVAAGAGAGGVALLAGVLAFAQSNILLIVAVFAALAAVACGAYLLWLKWREQRKAKSLSGDLRESRTPKDVAGDVSKKARHEDLRRKFQEGVEKFESQGKSLYALPWYVMAGPPGSGKTEAIRHSELKFPTGLQDKLQGAGGTYSMNWWFTNHAVIIDTAGRLIMEDPAEWKDFLLRLKKARPRCPINGMILAIDVRRLIGDDSAKIERDAGQIARQLEVIQRTLDVRFPVYVVVTMCDLLPGFREFFRDMDNPQLSHQMLGWSNPAELDTPFEPEEIEEHFEMVRQRLEDRRGRLLLDPVHTDDPMGRRIDQVDALYAFPEQVMRILPRLKRWLELIFTAGEWSPKPLFLRGIYFNSAMQEGKELDELVFRAMGQTAEQFGGIGGGEVFRKDKSYFIRDLFMKKVFVERGLVTNANNITRSQRVRRIAVVAAAAAFLLLLFGAIYWASTDLRSRIGKPAEFWAGVAKVQQGGESKSTPEQRRAASVALVSEADGARRYLGGESVAADLTSSESGQAMTRLELLGAAWEQTKLEISPGLVTRVLALGAIGEAGKDRPKVYAELMDAALVDLVVMARRDAANPKSWDGAGEEQRARALAALAQLSRLATLSAGAQPASLVGVVKDTDKDSGKALLSVGDLLDFVVPGSDPAAREARAKQVRTLETMITQSFAGDRRTELGDWPTAGLRAALTSDDALRELSAAAGLFVEYGAGRSGRRLVGAVKGMSTATDDFRKADEELRRVAWPGEVEASRLAWTIRDQKNSAETFVGALGRLREAGKRLSESEAAIGRERLSALLGGGGSPGAKDPQGELVAELARLLAELPPAPEAPKAGEKPASVEVSADPTKVLAQTLGKVRDDLLKAQKDQGADLAQGGAELRKWAVPGAALARAGEKDGFVYARVLAAFNAVGEFIQVPDELTKKEEMEKSFAARAEAIERSFADVRQSPAVREVASLTPASGEAWSKRLEAALASAQRHRVGVVVADVIDRLRRMSENELVELAKKRPALAGAQELSALKGLVLPMTGWAQRAKDLESGAYGASVGALLDDWSQMTKLVDESAAASGASGGVAPRLLDAKARQSELRPGAIAVGASGGGGGGGGGGIAALSEAYARFWLKDVLESARPDAEGAKSKAWEAWRSEMSASLGATDPGKINRDLQVLSRAINAAIDRLPASVRESDKWKSAVAAIRQDAGAPGGVDTSTFDGLASNWFKAMNDLASGDFNGARGQIDRDLSANLSRFPARAQPPVVAGGVTGPIWGYWHNLFVASVSSLATENTTRVKNAVRRLRELDKFPMNAGSSEGADLAVVKDEESARAARAMLEGDSPTRGAANIPDFGTTLTPLLRSLLGAASAEVSDAELATLRARAKVVNALQRWPAGVLIRPATPEELSKAGVSEPASPARAVYASWALAVGGQQLPGGQISAGEVRLTPEQAQRDVEFRFFVAGSASPSSTKVARATTGPWSVLWLVGQGGAADLPDKTEGVPARCVVVPVRVTDATIGGGERQFWVYMEISAPLPKLSEWPGAKR